MAIVFHVTLKPDVTPNSLDVDDSGKRNEISRSAAAQELQWVLHGNAASGAFNQQNASTPGFQWVTAPPSGIFSTPEVSSNGNQISINDTNSGPSTQGTWTYILTAVINGQTYSTQVQRLSLTTNNPIIVNK
jgi:hypothetical protein